MTHFKYLLLGCHESFVLSKYKSSEAENTKKAQKKQKNIKKSSKMKTNVKKLN